jgi:hypothetical protein
MLTRSGSSTDTYSRHRALFFGKLGLFFAERMPSILYCIVCAISKAFTDLCPFITQFTVKFN